MTYVGINIKSSSFLTPALKGNDQFHAFAALYLGPKIDISYGHIINLSTHAEHRDLTHSYRRANQCPLTSDAKQFRHLIQLRNDKPNLRHRKTKRDLRFQQPWGLRSSGFLRSVARMTPDISKKRTAFTDALILEDEGGMSFATPINSQ